VVLAHSNAATPNGVNQPQSATVCFWILRGGNRHQLTGIMVTVLLASFATQMLAPSKANALGLAPTE